MQNVIAQKIHTTCAKLADEKNNRLFCCVSVRDFEPKILIKGVRLTNCSIESSFFSYEERYTYPESKKAKKVYLNVQICILYTI